MKKVWFITGASRGFGYEFTKAALETGNSVIATARNIESLRESEKSYP
jgi:NADP-dependent 3-hydroxy acid dehydrogenase YdfG